MLVLPGSFRRRLWPGRAVGTCAFLDVLSGWQTRARLILAGTVASPSLRSAQFVAHREKLGIPGGAAPVRGDISFHLAAQVGVGNIGVDAARVHGFQVG